MRRDRHGAGDHLGTAPRLAPTDRESHPRRRPGGLAPSCFDLLAVVAGQAAELRLGQARGLDVDAPTGLSKVTLTT